jgi:hypothetical protein
VYEVLTHLLGDQFGLENWQSKIRHFVQAHRSYGHVTRRTEPETADIVFCNQNNHLESQFSRSLKNVSDVFDDWYPAWYQDPDRPGQVVFPLHPGSDIVIITDSSKAPLEWLFEVKATLGPCETDFYMSPNQFYMVSGCGFHQCSDYLCCLRRRIKQKEIQAELTTHRCVNSVVCRRTAAGGKSTVSFACIICSANGSASDSTLIHGGSEKDVWSSTPLTSGKSNQSINYLMVSSCEGGLCEPMVCLSLRKMYYVNRWFVCLFERWIEPPGPPLLLLLLLLPFQNTKYAFLT